MDCLNLKTLLMKHMLASHPLNIPQQGRPCSTNICFTQALEKKEDMNRPVRCAYSLSSPKLYTHVLT